MSYDQAIMAAKDVRKTYFTENCSLREAFKKIFKDKNIIVNYQEQGEKLKFNKYNNSYIITLPQDTSVLRDNYTIAHELGHIFLEHQLNEQCEIHRSSEKNQTEREANIFAAVLLLPQEQFSAICKKYNNNPNRVAAFFSVSPSAAKVRMSILKIANLI